MEGGLKVGALAKRTGLTVRTLHHYDEIGLLRPSRRTPSGHRLYEVREIERLQQIASLRQLGLALDEIKEALRSGEHSLERVLGLQIARVGEEIARQERLRALLEHLRDRLASAEGVSVEELTRTIEATMSYSKYYTPEQLDQLARRRDEVGQERIDEVQGEWARLFEAYERAMRAGLDPAGDEVQALARKSAALIEEFTGGDPGIRASLSRMYREEGAQNVMATHGVQTAPGLWEYMGRAAVVLRETPGSRRRE